MQDRICTEIELAPQIQQDCLRNARDRIENAAMEFAKVWSQAPLPLTQVILFLSSALFYANLETIEALPELDDPNLTPTQRRELAQHCINEMQAALRTLESNIKREYNA